MSRTIPPDNHLQGVDAISSMAYEAWLARVVNRDARISSEHAESARRRKIDIFDRVPTSIEIDLMHAENYSRFRNNLSTGSGSAGGFSIATGFVGPWEQALLALPMRALATTIRVDHVGEYREPTTDDSANEGVLANDNSNLSAVDIAFGQIVHRPRKFHSNRVLVPNELQEDSTNFAPQLASLLGGRVSRLQNRKWTIGTGGGEPQGLVAACQTFGATVSAASATAIAGDDILGLLGVVGSGYIGPACVFQMNRATLLAVLKLKDGQGHYLFDRASFTIAGFRVFLNYHVSDTLASGNCSVLFGDFSKYHIVDFGGVRLMRDSESHADSDQASWGAIQRSSGALVDAGTHPVAALIH